MIPELEATVRMGEGRKERVVGVQKGLCTTMEQGGGGGSNQETWGRAARAKRLNVNRLGPTVS